MTQDPEARKRSARDTLDGRYRLRAYLWDFPHRADRFEIRVSTCGRKPFGGDVKVRANHLEHAAALGNVVTCGSVWVCPVCSPSVAAQRSLEVQDTIRAWQASGGSVLLVTLTLSHSRTQRLRDTWDAITVGWKAVRNGGGWRKDKRLYGIGGYARVVEVTYGDNGWHPHIHVLLFVARDLTPTERDTLRASIFGRWETALLEVGYTVREFVTDPETGAQRAVAVDVRHADASTVEYLGEYLAKFGYTPRAAAAGLALEVARGDLKRGRKGSRTPWQLLEDAERGDLEAARLWAEWEETSLGRRQYAWAQGFRASLDLEEVLSDQEVAERESARLEVVARLERAVFKALVSDLRATRKLAGAPLLTRLLGAAATLEPGLFRAWLRRHDVAYIHPDQPEVVQVLGATVHAPAPGGVVMLSGEEVVLEVTRGDATPAPVAEHLVKHYRKAQRHREAVRPTRAAGEGPARSGQGPRGLCPCCQPVAGAQVLASRRRRLPLA